MGVGVASRDDRGDEEGVLDCCAEGEAARAVAEALPVPKPAVEEGARVTEVLEEGEAAPLGDCHEGEGGGVRVPALDTPTEAEAVPVAPPPGLGVTSGDPDPPRAAVPVTLLLALSVGVAEVLKLARAPVLLGSAEADRGALSVGEEVEAELLVGTAVALE